MNLKSLILFCAATLAAAPSSYLVYFGTYTGPLSKGIYAYRYTSGTGKLDSLGVAAEIQRPSWVTVHPNHKVLYAVSELGNNGQSVASITSYTINPQTGMLTKLNTVPSGGGGACHLAVDKTGHALMVANYGTGSVASFRLEPDGHIGDRVSLMQHSGSGPDQKRQRGPHAHAVVLSPDERFLFVPDLGLDKIMIYKLDAATATLTPNDPPFAAVKPGSGPRHFAFAPNGKFAYALSEMGSLVTAFSYDAARGALTQIQAISTLPADFKGENDSAEVGLDATGRHLYASNRGDNSIAVFSVDKSKGTLKMIQRVPTQGKTPRNFALSPEGRYFFAENQDSNNVVPFKVDRGKGTLTQSGQVLEVGAPVCMKFVH